MIKVKMDIVNIQKKKDIKDGLFIMNSVEDEHENEDTFNDVEDLKDPESLSPSTAATSLTSIKANNQPKRISFTLSFTLCNSNFCWQQISLDTS